MLLMIKKHPPLSTSTSQITKNRNYLDASEIRLRPPVNRRTMAEENSPRDHNHHNTTTAIAAATRTNTNNVTVDSYTCFLCYGRGHWARCCTSLPPIYLVENPPRCFTCGGIGHYARFCPSRLRIYNRFPSYTLISPAAAAGVPITTTSSPPYYEEWIRPRAISEPVGGNWAIFNVGGCDPLYDNFATLPNTATENHAEALSSTIALPTMIQHTESTLPPHSTSEAVYQQARDEF